VGTCEGKKFLAVEEIDGSFLEEGGMGQGDDSISKQCSDKKGGTNFEEAEMMQR